MMPHIVAYQYDKQLKKNHLYCIGGKSLNFCDGFQELSQSSRFIRFNLSLALSSPLPGLAGITTASRGKIVFLP